MKFLRKGKYIALMAILLFSLALTACDSGGDKEVVGKVDDVEITRDELNEAMARQYGEPTLNSLISEKIIELEIEKEDIKVDSKEIDEEFDLMAEQYGGKEGLEQAMAASNLTEEDIKDQIEEKLSIEKLLGDDVKVTDDEIKEYYEKNKDKFTQKEQVNASHVLVKDEDLAKDIKKKLDDGEDIGELAKEHSEDTGTKDQGGNLGFFGRGQMVEEFDKAAFDLEVGEISEPIKTEHGYHVIVVNEKKEEEVQSLEDIKDTIKVVISEEKMEPAFQEWYTKKAEEYEITNNLNN
ncbi:MAG: peptidyl-prolyl cis-trans isomerase [Tissierella sp.]|uniref:peptidyl-prolyl cis-trans isomerase n=1 Tax=Tissierella sp. TaxID=41274 RepID=UPI003F9A5AB1